MLLKTIKSLYNGQSIISKAPALYKIIRTEQFVKNSYAISKRFSRFSELIAAIDWALTRKPHYFNNVTGDYYFWKTEQLQNEDFPVVKLLYKIIEEELTVVLIEIEED